MSPRPTPAPPDRLRFQEPGGWPVIHEAGWKGPWPPPERLGMAVGHGTGYVSVFDPDDVTADELTRVSEVARVRIYRRVGASELPDDDSFPLVMRGAAYEPEEE